MNKSPLASVHTRHGRSGQVRKEVAEGALQLRVLDRSSSLDTNGATASSHVRPRLPFHERIAPATFTCPQQAH
jgi:hypothetical protein